MLGGGERRGSRRRRVPGGAGRRRRSGGGAERVPRAGGRGHGRRDAPALPRVCARWWRAWRRSARAPCRPFRNGCGSRLADLLRGAAIDPQRLAQEAAILADRSDIAEELVRLRTHAAQLDEPAGRAGEVGKRLDFLLQEMNREANTILSKTGGLGDLGLTITDLALAAKSEIDKIREQSEPG